jgi:BASS family bile acid:Na+ symporter
MCTAQVGMQNSALAAVLARAHFTDAPMAVVPCVLSACCHATLGSLLAGYWNAQLERQAKQQQQQS